MVSTRTRDYGSVEEQESPRLPEAKQQQQQQLKKELVQPLSARASNIVAEEEQAKPLSARMPAPTPLVVPGEEEEALPANASEFPSSYPIEGSLSPSPTGPPSPDENKEELLPLPKPKALSGDDKLLPKPHERKLGPGSKLPDGPEPAQVDVEYVPREQLVPLEQPEEAAAGIAAALGAADWVEAMRALNTLRQLAAHHPETCTPQLEQLMVLVLKSVRNLRSSLCKTAIMTANDLYISYGDALLPLSDIGGPAKPLTSMLAQLLTKAASNEKKFVVEEAQRAMLAVADSTTPAKVLPLLIPYVDHKNPKLRGQAGTAVAAAAVRMQPLELAEFGMPKLLQVAGKLVTDNTPDAREAAKRLVSLLSAAFAEEAVQAQMGVQQPAQEGAGEEEPSAWELFCQQNLSTSAALAVLKVSSN